MEVLRRTGFVSTEAHTLRPRRDRVRRSWANVSVVKTTVGGASREHWGDGGGPGEREERGHARPVALREMTQRYLEFQRSNEPVHTWPM